MPLSLRRGTVTEIGERQEGLVRLEVDGLPCIAYPQLTGPVALGDDVVVNSQALELGLGSGGFDVLLVNLTRGLGLEPEPGAHVMKLPYTPLQYAAVHAEEDEVSEAGADALAGTPVVCCSLHSQLAPVCAGLGLDVRVAYVQLGGGALPVSYSDTVRELQRRGHLVAALSAGPTVDGELEFVSLPSALAWCGGRVDVVVCALGPGIVGTASRYGHGAVAAAEAANAATALGGTPVVAARLSESDARERHRGLSHHTVTVLDLCLGAVRVAWPAGILVPAAAGDVEEVDVTGWREACKGLPLSHMGRGPNDDPPFFAAAFAAGRLARTLLPQPPTTAPERSRRAITPSRRNRP